MTSMNAPVRAPIIERRTIPVTELRVDADEGTSKPKIRGYAAVFDRWSSDLGGFRERVRRGAFTKTIEENDIRALFNHNPDYVLGRSKAGTLRLEENNTGLRIQIDPPEAQWAQDLVTSIQRGDIDGMSFSFQTLRDEWSEDYAKRELIEVKVFDVGPVTFPAYEGTTASARSIVRIRHDFGYPVIEIGPEMLGQPADPGIPDVVQDAMRAGDATRAVEQARGRLNLKRRRLNLAQIE